MSAPIPTSTVADRRPLVSVGLAVYNGEGFLEETLAALLGQTLEDFELIISDNASSDRTGEISRAAAARDPRVRYHRNPVNVGLNANWNGLFPMGSGRYFKWASADDICEPAYLERCVEVLEADPGVVLAYGRARFIGSRGETLDITDPGFDLRSEDPKERMRYVLRADHWVNATHGVCRADALRRTRLFPKFLGGDYVLLGELCLQGKLVEVPEDLFRRRIHPEASSQLRRGGEQLHELLTGGSGSVALPGWRRVARHLASVLGSDLPVRDKLELIGAVLHRLRTHREQLFAELSDAWRARSAKRLRRADR
jgi:glycosyltransferase involved in cell wall biosynthesis